MKNNLILFGISFFVFIVVDFLWLGVLMKNFYQTELANVGRFQNGNLSPILWAALVVYLLLPLGVLYFCLPISQSMVKAGLNGLLFGLVTYGVYEFTNFSLVANWSLRVVVADVIWGGFLCGLNSLLVFLVSKWLRGI